MKLIFSSSLGNVRQSYIQYKNMAAFIKIKKATITDQFLKTSSFKSFLTNEKSRSITLTIENIAFRSRVSNLTLMLDRWEEQKQENFSKRNKELFAPVLSTLIEIGNSYDLCQFFQNELPNFITENNLMISCGSFTTPGSDYGKIYDCASELSHYLCLDNYGPDSIIGNEIKQIKTFINEKQPKVLILIETISIYSNEIANFILKTEKERLEKKKEKLFLTKQDLKKIRLDIEEELRAKLEKEDKKFKFSSFIDSLRISFGRNPSDVNRYSWRDIIVKDAAKSDKRVKELMDAVILIEESIKRSEKLIESEIELDKILLTIYKLNLLVLENIDKTPRWYQIVIVSPNGILTHQAKVLALTQYSLIFLATLTFTGGAIGSLQNLPIIAGIYALLTNPDFIKALTSADYSKMTNSAVFTKLKQLYKDYIDFLGSNSK